MILYFIIFLIIIILLINKFANNLNIEYLSNPIYTIYTFWTGNNIISKNRIDSLINLENISKCKVILITIDNLNNYISNDQLHPAYNYLSETHKADYLRTYFMHFFGGGYSDIKKTTSSWIESYDNLLNSDYWICGYQEIEGGVAYNELSNNWLELIGNCAYICKPHTPLTNEWYNEMIKLLDSKLDLLKIRVFKNYKLKVLKTKS